MQANLVRLGRLEDRAEIRMRVPWPDSYWKTFLAEGQPYAFWDAKERAADEGMELIVKERKKAKVTLILLGNSRHEMGLFLEQVLSHCEGAVGAEAFRAVRVYLSLHPEMFNTDPASQTNLEADAENAPDPEMPADLMSEEEPNWSGAPAYTDEVEVEKAAEVNADDTVGSATVAEAENKNVTEPELTELDRQPAEPAEQPMQPQPQTLPSSSPSSSSESEQQHRERRETKKTKQPQALQPQPQTQPPLPAAELQQREQQEPLQPEERESSQSLQPTQQENTSPEPNPNRSIPNSFYQELEKSCAGAAVLGTTGHAISTIMRAQAESWQRTGRVNVVHDGRWEGLFVCMCSTMFRREASWKNAFPLQLAVALMFAPRVKIFLVTFVEDGAAWEYCFQHAQWAIDLGILYLASAGEMAGEVVPPSRRQQYWHASQCKNAAHVFAALVSKRQGIPPQNVLLVNVDADNIMPPAYLESLLGAWQAELQRAAMAGLDPQLAPFRPIVARSAHGGLTGRIATSLPDFARLGGYDQEPGTYGTGYQDIDLLYRTRAMVEQYTRETQVLLLRGDASVNRLPCEAGAAFDNEPNITVQEDRGSSKIKNLDPEVLKVFKTWGRINQANVRQLKEKLQRGLIGRNGMSHVPRLDQPAAWHVDAFLSLRLDPQFCQHPSPEVPWSSPELHEHLRMQHGPPLAVPSSVGSATELVGSCGSSVTTFATSKAEPVKPQATAWPVQKETTFNLVLSCFLCQCKHMLKVTFKIITPATVRTTSHQTRRQQ
jgi:hypothetical protein